MVQIEVMRAKIAHIEKNLNRLADKKRLSLGSFLASEDMQDIVLRNLQNSIQGTIDLASHIVTDEGWGVPGTQAEVFRILKDKKIIPPALAKKMVQMVGFRNILIHEYQDIDLKIVHRVLRKESADIAKFLGCVSRRFKL